METVITVIIFGLLLLYWAHKTTYFKDDNR